MLKVIPAMLVLIRWECPFVSCVTADNSPCSVFTCCRSQALLMPIGFLFVFSVIQSLFIVGFAVALSFFHSHFLSSAPVKPHPPEKLEVTVMKDQGWPFLRVSWEPPRKADTRSGWITLIYELRVKLEEEESEWEVRRSQRISGCGMLFEVFAFQI